jgi:hypothetical protein
MPQIAINMTVRMFDGEAQHRGMSILQPSRTLYHRFQKGNRTEGVLGGLVEAVPFPVFSCGLKPTVWML